MDAHRAGGRILTGLSFSCDPSAKAQLSSRQKLIMEQHSIAMPLETSRSKGRAAPVMQHGARQGRTVDWRELFDDELSPAQAHLGLRVRRQGREKSTLCAVLLSEARLNGSDIGVVGSNCCGCRFSHSPEGRGRHGQQGQEPAKNGKEV